MARYWLDSNVFIQAKNGYYRFNVVPAFWTWIDEQSDTGNVATSTEVYAELKDGNDTLAEWAKVRRVSSLFVAPDDDVQVMYADIVNHVNANYTAPEAAKFLARADPWLIAHAAASDDDVVVTHEVLVPQDARPVKVPNICVHIGVAYTDTFDMLEKLGAVF